METSALVLAPSALLNTTPHAHSQSYFYLFANVAQMQASTATDYLNLSESKLDEKSSHDIVSNCKDMSPLH